jgi:hypothetical protein
MAINIQQEMEDAATGVKQLSGDTKLTGVQIAADPTTEDLDSTNLTLGTTQPVTADQASTTGITTTAPTAPAAGVGQVGTISDVTTDLQQLGPATAAQLTPTGPYVDMTGVQANPSAGAIATAATQQLDPQATTQFQLGQLMSSLQSGGPMPPWAAPAVRKVNAVMQARGLGASSMAAAAMTQALMESGVQIAQQDITLVSNLMPRTNCKLKSSLRNWVHRSIPRTRTV